MKKTYKILIFVIILVLFSGCIIYNQKVKEQNAITKENVDSGRKSFMPTGQHFSN